MANVQDLSIVMMDEVIIGPHESQPLSLNQAQENIRETERQSIVETNLRSFLWSDYIDILLKVFCILLSIPWLVSIIFFSIFDTKCIVFEQASVINCSQKFILSNPEHWVFAWLLMSIIFSLLLIILIYLNHKKLNYQLRKARNIYKKGSFGSLIFLLLVSSICYFIRILTRSEKISISISILFLLWPPVTVVVVCCLNYLPRIHWKKISLHHCTLAWWKDCFHKNSNFIIYWLALGLYFIETTCKFTAIMLDVAHDVAPLIQNKFPEESGQFRGAMMIVIGFRLAFHRRLLSFFWKKLFHGEKDLFSEPEAKLVEESLVQDQQQSKENKLGGNVQLGEIICE